MNIHYKGMLIFLQGSYELSLLQGIRDATIELLHILVSVHAEVCIMCQSFSRYSPCVFIIFFSVKKQNKG